MQKFIVYLTMVGIEDRKNVFELPPKQMEHINCYSLMGKLCTSMYEHIDHRHYELHSIRIEPGELPVTSNEQSE